MMQSMTYLRFLLASLWGAEMNSLRRVCLVEIVSGLCACSMEKEEISRLVSPDHQTNAVLVREFGGGAAGSSNYYMYLTAADDKQELSQPNLAASCGRSIRSMDAMLRLWQQRPWHSGIRIR